MNLFVRFDNRIYTIYLLCYIRGDILTPYKGFTDAQAKAHKRFMGSRATIQLVMKPELRDAIKRRAASLNLTVNKYILGLVADDLDNGPEGE